MYKMPFLVKYITNLLLKVKALLRIKPRKYIISSTCHLSRKTSAAESKNHKINTVFTHLTELSTLKAAEIMFPRTDIVGVPASVSLQQLKKKFVETSFSKMPVYKNDTNEMLGFVHVKDLLPALEHPDDFNINKILRKFIYVPRSKKCLDLLNQMIEKHMEIAVVLDEYGGIDGLISIECMIKCMINGTNACPLKSNEDKNSARTMQIQKIAQDTYVINARTQVKNIEKELGKLPFLSEEDGEYETIAGFLLSHLNRIPKKGEIIQHPSGAVIEIIDANPRKINYIKITLPSANKNGSKIDGACNDTD